LKEIIPFTLAILTGLFTTLEAAATSELGKSITPKTATLHSMAVSSVTMLIINILGGGLNHYGKITNAPLKWSAGGIFGALAIYFLAISIPKLGVTLTFTIVITAQIVSSFFMDTFLFCLKFKLIQIIGLSFIITGLYLVMK